MSSHALKSNVENVLDTYDSNYLERKIVDQES